MRLYASSPTATGCMQPVAKQDTSSPTMRHHHRYHDVPWWATGEGAKAGGTNCPKKIQDGSICLALCALEHCGGRSLFGTSSRPHCGRLGSQLHSAPCELDENLSLVKRLRCRTLQKMQAVAQFPHVCFESNGSSLSQAPKDPFLL